MNKSASMLVAVLLVTAITASLVASSVAFIADSADADRSDKIKEKAKGILDKVIERIGGGGHRAVESMATQTISTRKRPKQKWWDPTIGTQSNFFNISPSNFKEWLWSAKVLTTIVWLLFPLGYVTIFLILVIPQPQKVESTLQGILIFNLSSEVTNGIGMGVIDVIVIPPIPIMVILFLFSVYPALYPTEKFFKKRGSVNVVIEYQYIRKILFAFLISLIVTIVMIYFLIPIMNEQAISQYAQGMSDMEIYKQVPLIPLIESFTLWYLCFLSSTHFHFTQIAVRAC